MSGPINVAEWMAKLALFGRQESPCYRRETETPTRLGQNDTSSKLYSQGANSGLWPWTPLKLVHIVSLDKSQIKQLTVEVLESI